MTMVGALRFAPAEILEGRSHSRGRRNGRIENSSYPGDGWQHNRTRNASWEPLPARPTVPGLGILSHPQRNPCFVVARAEDPVTSPFGIPQVLRPPAAVGWHAAALQRVAELDGRWLARSCRARALDRLAAPAAPHTPVPSRKNNSRFLGLPEAGRTPRLARAGGVPDAPVSPMYDRGYSDCDLVCRWHQFSLEIPLRLAR